MLTNMSFKASNISSFGEGSNGELYVVSLGGTIYQDRPADQRSAPAAAST